MNPKIEEYVKYRITLLTGLMENAGTVDEKDAYADRQYEVTAFWSFLQRLEQHDAALSASERDEPAYELYEPSRNAREIEIGEFDELQENGWSIS